MSKISIVGVEGSGKTTLMAAFGEKYERPDENGYGLKAENEATFGTVKMLADRLRHGHWPNATEMGTLSKLDWTLYRRTDDVRADLCTVSFLDFAGEVYRLAFSGRSVDEKSSEKAQITALTDHVKSSNALVVLVNLKDVIDGDIASPRTREMLWITQGIIDFAVEKCKIKNVVLAFSQAELYRETIEAVGGLAGVYAKYLPHIESIYPKLPLMALSAVDRTEVDADGYERPSPDYTSKGLDDLLAWLAAIARSEGEKLTEQKKIDLLQTVKPVFHRVGFRFSIVSTAVVAAFFSGSVTLVWHSACTPDWGLALWLSLWTPLPLALLLLLYAVARDRTRRTLKLFEQKRWVDALRSRFLAFGNDEWHLYRRACCSLFGLGCQRRNPLKAKRLLEKVAARRNPESFCVDVWIAEHNPEVMSFKRDMVNVYRGAVYYMAESRNSILVKSFTSGRLCNEVGRVDFDHMSLTVEKTPIVEQLLAQENGIPFLFSFVWLVLCAVLFPSLVYAFGGVGYENFFVQNLLMFFPLGVVVLFAARVGLTRRLIRREDLQKSPMMHGWRRFFTLRNDRTLRFAEGRSYLIGGEGLEPDVEKACDAFEEAACSGHAEACAVLAGLASSGRTKRYDALQVAWLVREAKARGSWLIERLEQPQDTEA